MVQERLAPGEEKGWKGGKNDGKGKGALKERQRRGEGWRLDI